VKSAAAVPALLSVLVAWGASSPPAAAAPLRFVVVGHLRGDGNGQPNPRLPMLVDEIHALAPDLVFALGDLVWGDVGQTRPDLDVTRADYDALDRELARIGAPVYRVPGNHDINDAGTRDLWTERYGPFPRAVDAGPVRFLLLRSAWAPEGDAPAPLERPFVRGEPLDVAQIDFVRRELSRAPAPRHVFLCMHHLLWWEPDAPWWTTVHPLLVGSAVRAVFGGDYGPMKFSHLRRDGIDYLQTSIEAGVSVDMLRALVSARLLSQQFDNYLLVTVDGDRVDVDVRTFGELESGVFSPDFWRAVNRWKPPPPPRPPFWTRVRDWLGTPRRALALAALVGLGFAAGFGVARLRAVRAEP
jgi:Calcineurin-like phosphoesterase